uniref:BHLH domain-containing protein n=1 Tax=Aegilops tauschii subsp. strangulata TaxID=200361 RepID=A0A453DN38_AEGTS
MKSRRQSDRGGAAAGAMALDGSHHTTSSGKMERKDVEKNRRLHMKGLCLKLSSLVPASSTHHLRHYSSSSSSPPSSNKAGRGDAAGPAGQRGGVHQAAPGQDRGPQAPQAGRPLRQHRWLLILRLRRRLQVTDGSAACDRGAAPGRDAGRGAGERGRASLPAARGDGGAGAGGGRGGQRQLLRRRRQDLLHAPFPGALPPHRPRRRPRRPEAPRPRR